MYVSSVYVCSMCMCKCKEYVYVCVYDMHMSMYPSPPVDVVGGGVKHGRGEGGCEEGH